MVGLVVVGGFSLAPPTRWGDPLSENAETPASMLFLDLILAALIPVSLLASWVVHRVRPGFLTSVTGRFRWRWLVRCIAVLLPLWAVYLTVSFLTDPPESGRPEQWVLLLVDVAGADPVPGGRRGVRLPRLAPQQLGAYFRHPVVGLVVSTVVSAAGFALAHGSSICGSCSTSASSGWQPAW